MEKPYHIVSKKDTQGLGYFLAKHGQALLPMVELIEQTKLAVDELIDLLGRAQVEAVLRLSAERIAGPPHPGKKGDEIGWHGREEGTVCLRERKLRVQRPRLRKKGQRRNGEVPVPAYEAMRSNARLGGRMLEILLRGFRCGSIAPYCERWPKRWARRGPASAAKPSRRARKNCDDYVNGVWTSWNC